MIAVEPNANQDRLAVQNALEQIAIEESRQAAQNQPLDGKLFHSLQLVSERDVNEMLTLTSMSIRVMGQLGILYHFAHLSKKFWLRPDECSSFMSC